MTEITAKVIEYSQAQSGKEIITYQLTYHRYIHAELMTHRVFSRNASSSRAIPVAKMLSQVWNDPAAPIHWGKNQPGMQAFSELSGWRKSLARFLWKWTGRAVCIPVYVMNKVGLAKQVANRLLEPWQWIHVVLTTTELDNWNVLRRHKDAQPEIHRLADVMDGAKMAATPVCKCGNPDFAANWHLPYVSILETCKYPVSVLLKLSAARCARVSYLLHDGTTPDKDKDLQLYDRLVASEPRHASPVEHQAYPLDNPEEASGNFKGWKQQRKVLEVQWYGISV